MKIKKNALSQYILVAGLAFVFLWFGIQKWLDPLYWMGFMPAFLESGFWGVDGETWLKVVGTIEVLLALFLIPKKTRFWAALFIGIHLLHIIFVVGFSDIGIRDIGLLSAAISLTITSFHKS